MSKPLNPRAAARAVVRKQRRLFAEALEGRRLLAFTQIGMPTIVANDPLATDALALDAGQFTITRPADSNLFKPYTAPVGLYGTAIYGTDYRAYNASTGVEVTDPAGTTIPAGATSVGIDVRPLKTLSVGGKTVTAGVYDDWYRYGLSTASDGSPRDFGTATRRPSATLVIQRSFTAGSLSIVNDPIYYGVDTTLFGVGGRSSIGATVVKWEWELESRIGAFVPDATGQIVPYVAAHQAKGVNITLRTTDSAGQIYIATYSAPIKLLTPSATFTIAPTPVGSPTVASIADIQDAAGILAKPNLFHYSFDFNNDGDFTDPGDVLNGTSPTASYTYPAAGNYVVHTSFNEGGTPVERYVGAVVYDANGNVDLTQDRPAAASSAADYYLTAGFAVDGYAPVTGTEWQSLAEPESWLELDLGATFAVSHVDVVGKSPSVVQLGAGDGIWTDVQAVKTLSADGKTASYDVAGTAGRYVRVLYTDGTVSSISDLRVYGVPPTATAPVPVIATASVDEGQPTLLVGSAVPAAGRSITTWEWDFDYDGTTFNADAIGQAASITLNDGPGYRRVALRTTDSAGEVSIASRTIAIRNLPPTATFNVAVGSAGSATSISFDNPTDASAADVAAGFKYSFDFNGDNDFTDTGDADRSYGSKFYVSYPIGNYTVHGRIYDRDGDYTSYEKTFTVVDASNIAAGKVTTALGTANAQTNGPEKATDNDLSTTWLASADRDYAWVQVDLKGFYNINSIVAVFGNANASSFSIQTSLNGTTWTPVASVTGNIKMSHTTGAAAGVARFARIEFTKREYASLVYSLADFRVYGTATLPPAPVVGFDNTGVNEGGTQTIYANSPLAAGQSIAKYEYDFNYDGTTFDVDATGQFPVFDAAGLDGTQTRTIAARLTDSFGQVGFKAIPFAIRNVAPTATLAAVGGAGSATATFASATDPSAADRAAGFRYSFDFNNDGDFTDPGEVDRGASPTATGTYAAAGTYTIVGRVYDKDGDYNKYVATVTVAAPPKVYPPSPSFTGATVNEGGTLLLNGFVSTTSGYAITKWEYDFDYDGKTFTTDATTQNATFSALNLDGPTTRQVAIRVTDSAGLVGLRVQTVSVVNVIPSAAFAIVANANGSATATFSNVTDVSAADRAAGFKYSFDFNGDGDFDDAGDVKDSTSPTATYAFAKSGTYAINARVADKDGGALAFGKSVTVTVPTTTTPTTPVQLTGKPIGTAGSIGGNTFANAFDGSLATYVDSTTVNGAWAGLDLGTVKTVTSVKFAPRATLARRMTGGYFQGSNAADFTGAVTLGTIATQPADGVLTTLTFAKPGGYRYVRYVAPAGSFGNVAEIQFFGTTAGTTTPPVVTPPPVTPPVVNPPTTPTKLNGTAIGTAGSIGGNTFANALDGNLATYVDSTTVNGAWVGLDLGTARVIKQIAYAPRATLARRMVGGYFQGSNSADFSNATTLLTLAVAPADGVLTTASISVATAFRYVRYVAPSGSFGNVAEVQFFG